MSTSIVPANLSGSDVSSMGYAFGVANALDEAGGAVSEATAIALDP